MTPVTNINFIPKCSPPCRHLKVRYVLDNCKVIVHAKYEFLVGGHYTTTTTLSSKVRYLKIF